MSELIKDTDQVSVNVSGDVADQAADPTNQSQPALIGDGKKYKDVLSADKALAEKEAFIKRLEEENAILRKSAASGSTIEEALKKLEAKLQPANSETTTQPSITTDAKNLDPQQIEKMVETKVSELERKRIQEENRLKVSTKLINTFGSTQKANEVIEQKAKDLGVDRATLTELAKTAPEMVIELFVPKGTNPATKGIIPGSSISPQANIVSDNFNPLKDPAVKQFGSFSLDGKTFRLAPGKGKEFEEYIRMKAKR